MAFGSQLKKHMGFLTKNDFFDDKKSDMDFGHQLKKHIGFLTRNDFLCAKKHKKI